MGIKINGIMVMGPGKNVPNNGFSILPNEFWVYSEREKNNLLKGFKSTPS